METSNRTLPPPVLPNIEDWPVYRLSEDRKQFVDEIEEYTINRIQQKSPAEVNELIAKTIFQERIRLKEAPWKVDPPDEKSFWKETSKRHAQKSLDRSVEEAVKSNTRILRGIVNRYAEEIVGTFSIKTFRFARRFLTFFFTRLLNAAAIRRISGLWGSKYHLTDKMQVHGELETVRALMDKGTVVVVPTHFSNLDSILIGYALDTFVGLPSFSYGAGLNLYNTGYTAYFMNRLGAYRVDRRKKNAIYLETLKAMSMLSIKRGVNSLFFPGGTRSRSGHMEKHLKMGLLGTAVEAQRALLEQGKTEKVFIVPLVLSYHFVLEAEFLIEQYLREMGKEQYVKNKDDFYSPFRVFRFVWKVFLQGNDITLSVGQPMDVLGNPVDAQGISYDQHQRPVDIGAYFTDVKGALSANLQRESEYTQLLATKIADRYLKDNIVLSSHLVAFAAFELLKHQHPHLDLYGILRLPEEDYIFEEQQMMQLLEQLQQRLILLEQRDRLKLADEIRLSLPQLLEDGLEHLGTFHVNSPLYFNSKHQIVSDSFKTLYYYHNRLDSYSLEKSIDWKKIHEDDLMIEEELWDTSSRNG